MPSSSQPSSRHARIAATLQGIVGRVLRIEPRDLDIEVPFLELGADSLALVEALRGLQEAFGVKLTIRQLFEQLPTISALAAFLEQTVPAEPGNAAAPPDPHPPAPSPIPLPSTGRGGDQHPRRVEGPKARASSARGIAPGSEALGFQPGLEGVFGMQIQAFNQLVAQQLAMLGGRAPAPVSLPAPPTPEPKLQPAPAVTTPAAAPVLPTFVGKAGGRSGAELNERQRRHLDALIERYCRKTAKSKELTQKYRPWLADSRATVGFRPQIKEMLYPLARARSQGARLWDIDGNEYVDVTMGMGVHLFGHDPEFLRETLAAQVREGFELGPRSAHSGEVAALFCELTGMERATFTNSGTEACMTAIRLARARTGRSRIVMFAGSYHGHSDGTLAQTQEVDGELRSFPVAPGVPAKVAEDVLVLDYGTPEALEIIRRLRGELAAVIVEPIQSRRPAVQPREFLHELRVLTAESGIALIFDEMICGFRLHLGGAQAWFGVRADIATYGKIIGGGLPIGVVAGSADYMDGIDGGLWRYGDDSHPERDTTFFGGTFCQHPLAMAAARRVLRYLKEQGPGLQETLNARTARFAGRLNDWFKAEGVPIRTQHAHSLFRFAFSANAELLYYHMVEKGVYVWEWRNCFLSTAHTDADLDFIVNAVQESVGELRRGGFLPEKPDGGPSGGGERAKGFWDRQAKPAIAPSAPVSAALAAPAVLSRPRGVDFSLYFFGHYAAEFQAGKYDLLLDCARFADRHGFTGLWFPERHFHPFGGISPNPSVLAAALARETERIALRAGSVVLPLHHPLRVAEEWALVDNLSAGRVGLSYASGWHPNDFALAPEAYGKHRELMIERAAIVDRLWRGEALRVKDGAGTEVDLRIYPLPARRDLPIWITIVNNPETYRLAGEMGAGVLTNLMGQTVDGLAANLALYREALAAAGHPPDAGHVTLLLHTFVGADAEAAVDTARRPFYSYMESSVGLLKNMLASEGTPIDWDNLSRDDLEYMLELAYQRYVKTSALIGSVETTAPIVERLRAAGVDEIACLIDFGVAPDAVRASLPWMAALKDRFLPRRPTPALDAAPVEFPLTEAQNDLWTVAQLGGEASLAYLEAAILELRGPLDLPLLRRALQTAIDRHEALRTVILPPAGDRVPLQRVLPALDLTIPLVDATGCPPEMRAAVSRQWLDSESRRPFDLARGPLVRFTMLRLDGPQGAQCHQLGAFVHHIMADGLSLILFLKEVLAVYEAGRAGRRAVLPEPLQFRDYAAWLAQGGDESAADEAYWLRSFAGAVPVFDPPTDHPRPAVRSFRGGRQRLVMDPAVYRALHQAGRRQGATLFISLLAVWNALLHRWTGQDDLVVGGPTARRPLEGGDRLVGHCVDLVPYRSRLGAGTEEADEAPFLKYLAAVRTTVLDAHDHGAWPLVRLLRALELPHDPSRAPLINAVFNLDPGPGITKAAGLELAERSPAITHAKFDVALHVLEAGGELILFLDHRRDLFDAVTMDRLLGHLVTLAAGVAAEPARHLAEIPLLTVAEQQQLLEDWNRTAADYPRDSTVHDLFAAVAARDPLAPAVIWAEGDGEAVMTYGELADRAGRLAEQLRALGVGPDTPVVLDLERSPDLVVAMLAVLQAGGAYVPVDPSDPEERRAFLMADSGAQVRVGKAAVPEPLHPHPPGPPLPSPSLPPGEGGTASDMPSQETGGGAPLPAVGGELGEGSGVRAPDGDGGDALAYVIYTSGSTGRPKGVAVPHRAVVRLVLNTDYIHLGPGDRVAHLSNTAFDAATFEVWGALLNGAALVVIPRETVLVPAALGEEFRRRRVTSTFLTASLFHELVREAPETLRGGLRDLLVGGEAPSPGRVREALATAGPELRLVNAYGPTESTTFAMFHPVKAVPPGERVPLGRPIANTRVWLLDRGLRLVPPGAPGELCIGGDGLARGYLGRPDLTAERFAPNPFENGARLYRTGDLARMRSDGDLEYLGRFDGQVKVRGFRVELGEIEAALERCPGVRAAVVTAQEIVHGQTDGKRLAAHLILDGTSGQTDPRAFLSARLPAAMIPAAFVVLDAFPLTPSGKVDRRALAQAAARPFAAEPERTAEAPRTPVEEIIAAVWANVLAVETIGIRDDFFALGGHSLLAGRVLARLRSALGAELSLRDFFQAPTVAGLAEKVQAARDIARDTAALRAVPPLLPGPLRSREAGVPLSFAQERLWLVEKLEPGTPLHGIPLVHRISGPLRPDLLAAALARLVERQEALRTVFLETGGTPVQMVVSAAASSLPLVDFSGLPEGVGRSAAERLAAEASLQPFDLTAGPLRAFLIRCAAGEHTLFLNVHHIVADEWSLEVMARELSELYAAGAAARAAALPPLPVQPADFAVWQRGWLRGAALAESLAWWRAHLAGAPRVLDLPSDRAPGAAQTFRGNVERMTVPNRSAAVRRLAREQGSTFFLTLFAVFQVLLHRLTGTTDLLVGTPVAGRDRTELEGLVGFFVNTLVLRTDVSGLPTFAELLARVREEALNAYPHLDLPFTKLVEALAPQRGAARNPLVQVTFSVPDLSSARLALGPDLHDAIAASTTLTSKFDLSLFVGDSVGDVEGALEIEAELATDLFDAVTVRGLMTRYALLLDSCLADPETPVESLAWMTAAEQEQLLAGSRAPVASGAPAAVHETVHGMVASWAAREPGRSALIFDEGRMTYGELAARAGALARRLTALGLAPEARVGVFLERSPSLIAALLAVLQAGAAYVPLDPEEPAERLEMILEDAGAAAVLTEQSLAGSLPDGAIPRLLVDGLVDEPGEARSGERDRTTPDSLAYVAFTSGSTGRPKGVAVPHGAVVRLIHDPGFARLEGEVFLQVAPVAFDASTLEIWGALANGGQLVLPRPGRLSAWEIAGVIERHQVTTAWLTAALFLQVLEESAGSSLRSLRQLLVGGDVVPAGAVRRCLELVPGLRVIHAYGPTENTTFTTTSTLADPAAVRSPLPLGRPIHGTDVSVADATLRLVPPGVPGELVTGGRGLARGYQGRPDLTAERFVPHPFAAAPGERLYRTGDLVRYAADGVLEFLGRRDAQVKVRGVRIELAEIESALAACPGVREGAVIVRRRGGGDESLVAFFVARSAPSPEPAALRGALRAALPPAMLPSVFFELDALPLTASGKLDRRELEQAAEVDASETLAAASPDPRTPLEEVLAGIWAAVLRVERVGVHDDFFLLGGHSLLAAVILSRVRDQLGVELTLRVFFSASTVAQLAVRIEEAFQQDRPAPPPPIARAPRDGRLPLSFAQERLWFLEKLLPGTSMYSVPLVHRMSGPLRTAALAAAFAALVRRHEALRTVFVEIDGEPFQTILDTVPDLPLVDLTGVPEARRESETGRLLESEARRPFDLAAGPLVRALLVRTAAAEHALLIATHHIVSDGWSADVMARDLSALYAGRPLPELPVQVPDVAVWQRSWLTGEALEHRLAWWRVRLAGCPTVLDLPADRPSLPVRSGRGGIVRRPLPGLLDGVRSLGQRLGTTPFLAYLTAFQVLLQRWTGQPDLLVGTPVAGRGRSELEGLIGFFVNTLPLRAEPSGERTFNGLLARVREAALGAFEHQDLPFEKLVEALVPERDLSRNPLVQVVFSAPDLAAAHLDLGPDLRTAVAGVWPGTAKLDLSVAVEAREGGLFIDAEYDAGRFEGATIERLLGHFRTLLAACVETPDAAVDDLPWLSETETRQLVEEWNQTAADYPRDTPLHEIFTAVAARDPHAPAIVWSAEDREEALTYADLQDRAERLAGELRALGAGPETPVALDLERSPELVTAMLAVLLAGGAYVPLDPADPAERRAFLLEDSGARLRISLQDGSLSVSPLPGTGREEPGEGPGARASEALAYILYTSGSTGRPKGVAVPHRAVARLVLGTDFVRIGPDDRVAHLSNTAFDAATLEVWGALLNGAALVVLPREVVLAPARLADAFRRHRVTIALPTVVVFNEIVREAPDLLRAGTLRYLFSGGEAASPGHMREAVALAHPGLRITNAYGPTESTCIALTHRVEAVPPGTDVPIGLPIANTRAWVVDRALRPVPAGTPGELCLGGDGLARGYFGRPDLTAERFVPNPFADGERLYRTGDLVRRRPDGVAEYLGRTDAQVKVRGVRIEPGEIEAVLSHCPRVRSAAVVARDEPTGRRLVACLVLDEPFVEGTSQDVEPFRTFLRDRLPEPMVPSFFVVLDAFALTPSGKVDRAVLRQLAAGLSSLSGAEGPSAPRTPAEEIMAGIWAEVLQLERVGMQDDFFALGGHSLLAGRVLARVRSLLGAELAVQDVFRTPTVAGLARRAEEVRQEAQGISVPPLRRVPRNDPDHPLRLSFAQERLWLIDQLQPGSSAYNSFLPALLTGRLHEPALEAALGAILRRHEVLRTHFVPGPGGPVQRIAPPDPSWRLPVVDLRGLADAPRAAEVRRLVAAEARWPFDLARGPLVRATLARLGETEHALLLNLHHAVCDGWSLEEVLTAEMSTLYRGALTGRPSPLPALPVHYADFAGWQRQWLQGEVLDRELAWWKEHLGGEPPALDLPADHLRPPVPSGRGAAAGIVLPPAVVEPLAALGRRRGVTLFMLLLAVLQALLHRWSGQERISVGTPVANRGRLELEGLIGFFINTLVLCTDLSGNPSGITLLDRVRDLTLGAFDHQDLPFEKLVAAVQTRRDPSRNPLFQVLFVLQNNRSSGLDLPGIDLSLLSQGGASAALFDLSFSAMESAGSVVLTTAYSLDLFERPAVDLLLDHFRRLAEALADDPERAVDDIPLLSIPERRQLMASEPAPAAAEGPAPEAVREEIRQRRQQLAGRRKQLSPERQALLRKWVGGGPEEARPAVAPKPEPPRVAPLVAIQPRSGDSSRAPLFLVHPGNGNVNNYLDLVKHLGPDQPVYALQAPGLTSGDVLQGMDSFADCYLQAIRELQPHGPYRLGGWCMGGAIAHAIASRLHAAGEEIEILLLIDSYAPPEGQAGPADEVSLLATLANDFGGASAMRMKVPVDVLRSLPEAERLPWIVDRARSAGILPEGFALEQARRDWEVFRAIVRAIEGYARPEPLPVHAVLYRAAVQPSNAQDPRPALGWDRWIASPPEGRLEIIPVDGDHYAVVREPLVGIVAREMAGRLAAEAVSAG